MIPLVSRAVRDYTSTWFQPVPYYIWSCAWTAGLALLFSFPCLRAWARPGQWAVNVPFLVLSAAVVVLGFVPLPVLFFGFYAPFVNLEAGLLIAFYSIIHIFVKTPPQGNEPS